MSVTTITMEVSVKRIIVLLAVTLFTVIGLSIPAYANVSNCLGPECIIYYGSNHGWNDWNGTVSNGAAIKYYQSLSAENSEFDQVLDGVVCNGEPVCGGIVGPFTNGSGLNARYDGDVIYTFETSNNTNYCVTDLGFNDVNDSGNLELDQCSTTANVDEEFVLSSTFFMASVGASNAEYAFSGSTANLPVLVGDFNGSPCSVSNGQSVTIAGGGNCQLQYSITNSS